MIIDNIFCVVIRNSFQGGVRMYVFFEIFSVFSSQLIRNVIDHTRYYSIYNNQWQYQEQGAYRCLLVRSSSGPDHNVMGDKIGTKINKYYNKFFRERCIPSSLCDRVRSFYLCKFFRFVFWEQPLQLPFCEVTKPRYKRNKKKTKRKFCEAEKMKKCLETFDSRMG